MARLIARRWARPSGRSSRNPHARFVLTDGGLAAMVDVLTSEVERRTFEEALFVVCFAASYGSAISDRASRGKRRELSRRLDPQRLLRAARNRVDRVMSDLEERVRSSQAMHEEAVARRARGESDASIAAALDRRGAYQLQHVRSFRDVMLGLPSDLLHFELGEGLATRSRLLFSPMLAQAKAQREVLAALRT